MIHHIKSIECTKLKDYLHELDDVISNSIIEAYQDNSGNVLKIELLQDFKKHISQIIAICKERNKF